MKGELKSMAGTSGERKASSEMTAQGHAGAAPGQGRRDAAMQRERERERETGREREREREKKRD